MKKLPFSIQEAFQDTGSTVQLKVFGKLLNEDEFRRSNGGFSAAELQVEPTTLPSQFGPKTGFLVEDTSRDPQIEFTSSLSCVLRDITMTASRFCGSVRKTK